MKQWYYYRSKDKKVQGIAPVDNIDDLARLYARYPVGDLFIQEVEWNGREFVKCQAKK